MNTFAYYDNPKITAVKSLIVPAPGVLILYWLSIVVMQNVNMLDGVAPFAQMFMDTVQNAKFYVFYKNLKKICIS